jgi:hypothetical protein
MFANVIHEKKFIWFLVPKVACSSIRKLWLDLGYIKDVGELSNCKWDEIDDEVKQTYFKFAFVRHPLDRLVSFYFNMQQKPDFSQRVCEISKGQISGNMLFEDLVNVACDTPDPKSNIHFKSQTTLIPMNKNQPSLDFTGRFEMLRTDWRLISTRLKLPPLPHAKKTFHDHFETYYTFTMRQKACQRFRRDLRILGYR